MKIALFRTRLIKSKSKYPVPLTRNNEFGTFSTNLATTT